MKTSHLTLKLIENEIKKVCDDALGEVFDSNTIINIEIRIKYILNKFKKAYHILPENIIKVNQNNGIIDVSLCPKILNYLDVEFN